MDELSPAWHLGERKRKQYINFRHSVFQKHKFKCFISGSFEKLTLHHINNDVENITDSWECVPLNDTIHKMFHRLYGFRNNNLNQLFNFKWNYKQFQKYNKTFFISYENSLYLNHLIENGR